MKIDIKQVETVEDLASLKRNDIFQIGINYFIVVEPPVKKVPGNKLTVRVRKYLVPLNDGVDGTPIGQEYEIVEDKIYLWRV